MKTMLLTAALDRRHGKGRIGSRLGLERRCLLFFPTQQTGWRWVSDHRKQTEIDFRVLVDEAQFLTDDQVSAAGGNCRRA